ncbi:hypothetical protein V1478_010513 [Vespula squamosa]|uniref:Uncharacterized protein n=1 Tax=Vespula squamosa TaxID=30214 RepID=A0ABD2AIV8_VESSQ
MKQHQTGKAVEVGAFRIVDAAKAMNRCEATTRDQCQENRCKERGRSCDYEDISRRRGRCCNDLESLEVYVEEEASGTAHSPIQSDSLVGIVGVARTSLLVPADTERSCSRDNVISSSF